MTVLKKNTGSLLLATAMFFGSLAAFSGNAHAVAAPSSSSFVCVYVGPFCVVLPGDVMVETENTKKKRVVVDGDGPFDVEPE